MTKRQLGGYEFNSECANIRNSTDLMNRWVSRLLDENPGPQTTAVIYAKIAIEINKINSAIATLEDIAQQAKGKK